MWNSSSPEGDHLETISCIPTSTNDSNTRVCGIRVPFGGGSKTVWSNVAGSFREPAARFPTLTTGHRDTVGPLSLRRPDLRQVGVDRRVAGVKTVQKCSCPLQRAVPPPTMRNRKYLPVPCLWQPLRVLVGELELLRVHIRQRIRCRMMVPSGLRIGPMSLRRFCQIGEFVLRCLSRAGVVCVALAWVPLAPLAESIGLPSDSSLGSRRLDDVQDTSRVGIFGSIPLTADRFNSDPIPADTASHAPVPEPSTLVLLALAAIPLVARTRRMSDDFHK